MEDAPFTVTLKAGSSMDSPWIILKADTADALKRRLNALEREYLPQAISRISKGLQDAYKHEQERLR